MTKTDWKKWGKLICDFFVPKESKFIFVVRTECIVSWAIACGLFLCGLFYYVLKGLPIESYMQVLDWSSDLPQSLLFGFWKNLIKVFVYMGWGATWCYIYALCWRKVYAKRIQRQKVVLREAEPEQVFNEDIIGLSKTVFNAAATTPNVQPHVSKKKSVVAKHYNNNEYSKETKKYHKK